MKLRWCFLRCKRRAMGGFFGYHRWTLTRPHASSNGPTSSIMVGDHRLRKPKTGFLLYPQAIVMMHGRRQPDL
ncbi:hypothetical protein M8C21_030538 [Ambrosia artemisiifolia]|uniref:Uncharacterized protein n=1 Tax=Ambrosia artemisiifolia TaxID=4212 RepID=A0AAD5CCV1_AMBAR|nr:hypothetical protein M8C21_030538 [Ambrosia artemisiifolia]